MLTVMIWDVQHGSAAYFETPAGKHLVQDLGVGSFSGFGPTFSPLIHLKQRYNVRQLDEVIISHPHGDHLDDILNFDLLSPLYLRRPRHLTPQEIMDGNPNSDERVIGKYLEVNGRYIQEVLPGNNPELATNNGGVEFKLFTPTQCSRSNLNNHSIVTVLSYETCKLILPGDNESPSWNELLQDRYFIDAIEDADLLVAPHHGRQAGYCSTLFNYFNPRLTIISDGRFCDTSATSRYSQVSRGWTVHHRNGWDEERKVISTRSDGVIVVQMGRGTNNRPYISVTVN
jgi:beta-lactamase superfamily II metal-dependent hydrolase